MTQTSFKLTARQQRANQMLGSDAVHNMLYGGSRSGKTFLLVRAVITRALAKVSRHAILRFRFNHVKASIVYDTLPKVTELCFPGVAERSHLDKSDWFYKLPNGSEVWFGGLDDKERTEKILGQEYATIYLNECSQIPWSSRNMAITRLAQNTGLRLKMYYDCNPPSKAHWTYKIFVDKKDPDRKGNLVDGENYLSLIMNPRDNKENLPDDYLKILQNLPERERQRFWDGMFGDLSEGALWYLELLDKQRILDGVLPDMQRIIVAVDPSGCRGEEDTRSDEVGIVVGALGSDGNGYVIEDLSGKHSAAEWPKIVSSAFTRHEADCVVAEGNYGGDMVRQVIQAENRSIPFKMVTATRGKVVRAEPISTLFEQGKLFLVGYYPELEEQLCAMTKYGYMGSKSPDRADAMVWLFHEIFPSVTKDQARIDIPPPKVIMSHRNARRRRV